MQKDRVAKVRAYAVLAIKNMGEEGKPALEKVILVLKKDKDNLVCCVACDTLARLGPAARAGVPALAAVLKHKEVGPHAAAALRRYQCPRTPQPGPSDHARTVTETVRSCVPTTRIRDCVENGVTHRP